MRAPDITPAPNGVVAAYTPADWVRTVRHGVKPDGTPVMIMPSEEYNRFVDADLAAVVAYVRQLPPRRARRREIRLPMPVKALYAAGVVQATRARRSTTRCRRRSRCPKASRRRTAPMSPTAASAATAPSSTGGKIPGAPPDWPPAARLAPGPGNALDRYPTAEQFMAMLKTGKRPDGSSVSTVMPFASLKEMNEVDVRALYLHLRSLPAGS